MVKALVNASILKIQNAVSRTCVTRISMNVVPTTVGGSMTHGSAPDFVLAIGTNLPKRHGERQRDERSVANLDARTRSVHTVRGDQLV